MQDAGELGGASFRRTFELSLVVVTLVRVLS
jgi:hypothetical protein